jgi:hypothetical protein
VRVPLETRMITARRRISAEEECDALFSIHHSLRLIQMGSLYWSRQAPKSPLTRGK